MKVTCPVPPIASVVPAVSKELSALSKDPRKAAQVATLAVTNVLWVRGLTKDAQLSQVEKAALLLVPTLTAGIAVGMEMATTRLSRPVTADEAPSWHTYNHVGLLVSPSGNDHKPSAHLMCPAGNYRMVVNEAFLSADAADQKQVFNTALDNDGTNRVASVSFRTLSMVLFLAQRGLFVEDRASLSVRRASALAVTATARSFVAGRATKVAMKRVRETHLRAGASTRW